MIIINKNLLFYHIKKSHQKCLIYAMLYTFIFTALYFFNMLVVHFSSIFAFLRGSSELRLKLRTQPSLLSNERATLHIIQSSRRDRPPPWNGAQACVNSKPFMYNVKFRNVQVCILLSSGHLMLPLRFNIKILQGQLRRK